MNFSSRMILVHKWQAAEFDNHHQCYSGIVSFVVVFDIVKEFLNDGIVLSISQVVMLLAHTWVKKKSLNFVV